MEKETRQAAENAAAYLCSVLNPILRPLYGEALTPHELIYRLLIAEEPLPDGRQEEIGNTLRGVEQRLFHLHKAVTGHPSTPWLRYWNEHARIPRTNEEKVG